MRICCGPLKTAPVAVRTRQPIPRIVVRRPNNVVASQHRPCRSKMTPHPTPEAAASRSSCPRQNCRARDESALQLKGVGFALLGEEDGDDGG